MSMSGSIDTVPKASIKQIKIILSTVIDDLSAQESQGIFLWGPPGIGKSSLVKQIARDRGMKLVDLRLPLLDPVDLRGLPMVEKETGKARWLPPDFLPDQSEKEGILFLDEINAAPPSVQAAAYQLVLDRKVGEYRLPPGWIVIAAGNRAADRSVSYRLPTALANRFTHFEVIADVEEWKAWAMSVDLDPYVYSFITYHNDMLMKFDPSKEKTAFATPRSWEFVSKVQKLRDTDFMLYNLTVKGTVGQDAGEQFISFLNFRLDLPDPIDILEGKPYEMPTEIDAAYVLMGALIGALRTHNSEEHIDNFINYVYQWQDTPYPDYAVVLMRSMIWLMKKIDKLQVLMQNENYRKWLMMNADVITPDE